jgi:UDP-N-acetylmuramoylalanine--D-glutamate ligase
MILILGMGITGLSVARFLSKTNKKFILADSRQTPPLLEDFLSQFPDKNDAYFCGHLEESLLNNITKIVVSPGIDLNSNFIKLAIKKDIQIIGDMDLFFENTTKPVIGITGTNGKSTVTTLLTKMINDSGLKAVMGGNIGKAVLDCLDESIDFYILELSSYQLDLTKNMPLEAAVVLNISQDHLERYPNFTDYINSKLSIYDNAKIKIINNDDEYIKIKDNSIGFSLGINSEFSRVECHGSLYLLHKDEVLLNINELNILGEHNHANALATLALGDAIGLDKDKMLASLKEFSGLKHRLQKITQLNNIDYFNDSKATNSDAAIVAIKTLKDFYNNIVVIIGGVAKEKDYQILTKIIKKNIQSVILIGESTTFFLEQLQNIETIIASDINEAVNLATKKIKQNTHQDCNQKNAILLSPACASFDMFINFEHRGDAFIKAVQAISD